MTRHMTKLNACTHAAFRPAGRAATDKSSSNAATTIPQSKSGTIEKFSGLRVSYISVTTCQS